MPEQPMNIAVDLLQNQLLNPMAPNESQVFIKNNSGVVDQVMRIFPSQNSESVIDIEYSESVELFESEE